jgi:hypothetical protein
MPKNINLFIRVVDNLWDIGFAAELVRSFHEHSRDKYFFDIWTDSVEKVTSFFEKNPEFQGSYSIREIENIKEKKANISFLLFHHPIPANYHYGREELFLRIDYLSFDPEWVIHHGKEHIDSRENRRIIEIIPSPLSGSAGLIPPPSHLISKHELAEKYGLDHEKKWIAVFAYHETRTERLTIESIDDTQILMLWIEWSENQHDSSMIHLPFLSLTEFSSIIHESAWAIIRWEVSFISTFQLGTPFFWDMYKEIGWFHSEQAEQFLDWQGAPEAFRDLFFRLNGVKEWSVKISEIESYFAVHQMKKFEPAYSIITEIQKYIDKYHISL